MLVFDLLHIKSSCSLNLHVLHSIKVVWFFSFFPSPSKILVSRGLDLSCICLGFSESCLVFYQVNFGFVCFIVFVFLLYWGELFWGVRGIEMPARCVFTNRQNKSLISVDRRTSLLSHVQYSVLYQSRLQRIYRSQCPKGDEYGVGPKPIATREHRERIYRRFPA